MKKKMKEFLVDITKRTIKTACETASGFLVYGLALNQIDWKMMGSVTAVAAIACIVINLPSIPLGESEE